jgi:hypothetical protein
MCHRFRQLDEQSVNEARYRVRGRITSIDGRAWRRQNLTYGSGGRHAESPEDERGANEKDRRASGAATLENDSLLQAQYT